MYKGSIDLGRINATLRLGLNVVLKRDDYTLRPGGGKVFKHVVDIFDFNGSRYLKVTPKAYITLDISKAQDKGDKWNSNLQANLTKPYLFEFISKCKIMIENFKIKDLFYIKNKKLQINVDVANSVSQVVRTPNKTIKMIHSVVYDAENKEIEYEGIVLMINSIDNFALLTYNELQYLCYTLMNTNIDILAMQLINSYLILNTTRESIQPSKIDTPTKMISETSQCDDVVVSLPKEKKDNTIPNI